MEDGGRTFHRVLAEEAVGHIPYRNQEAAAEEEHHIGQAGVGTYPKGEEAHAYRSHNRGRDALVEDSHEVEGVERIDGSHEGEEYLEGDIRDPFAPLREDWMNTFYSLRWRSYRK